VRVSPDHGTGRVSLCEWEGRGSFDETAFIVTYNRIKKEVHESVCIIMHCN